VIVDRFARFKIGEAALADMAAAAHRDSPGAGPPHSSGEGEGKVDYKTETYHMNMNPGEEMIQDKVGRKTFLGAPAGASMLRRVCRLHSTFYRKEGLMIDPRIDFYSSWIHLIRANGRFIKCSRGSRFWDRFPRYAQDIPIYDHLVAREL
jgi:hypothetical protein